jgi:hypothetical protein
MYELCMKLGIFKTFRIKPFLSGSSKILRPVQVKEEIKTVW